jgi:hypothetical protein
MSTMRLEELLKGCSAPISEATLPNSMMDREQSDRFFDLVRDTSNFLRAIRTMRVDNRKGKFHRLNLGDVVSQGANTTTCPVESRPEESMLTYDLEKYGSFFSITTDMLRYNVEGPQFLDTLMGMFKKQISVDIERASIMGDTGLPVGDGQSKLNNLLGINDGFLRVLKDSVPSSQVIDASGAGLSTELLFEIQNRIPVEYMSEMDQYRWIMGPRMYNRWVQQLTSRATNLGDQIILNGGQNLNPLGESVFRVNNWPENLDNGGGETDGTYLLYTPMENLVYVTGRDLTVERERKPRGDRWEYTMWWEADFMVENPDMVVLVKNLQLCGTPATGICSAGTQPVSHNPTDPS